MLLCIALTAGEWGFEAGCSGYQMATLKGSERENIKGPGLQIIVWAVISHCLLSGISLVFLFFFYWCLPVLHMHTSTHCLT